MRIVASAVSMGKHGLALPESNVAFETGRVTIAVAETGQRPTVLSLILSGRMRPATGAVTIDGEADARALSDRVALVDAPDVSEPPADVRFDRVVREELAFSGRSASRETARAVIDEAGGTPWLHAAVDEVPAGVRVRVLAELAAFRRGIEGVVLCSPDRHGGDPREWLDVALDLARRDFAVLVVVGAAAAEIVAPLIPVELLADGVPEVPSKALEDEDEGEAVEAVLEPSPQPDVLELVADPAPDGRVDEPGLVQGELAPAAMVAEHLDADRQRDDAARAGYADSELGALPPGEDDSTSPHPRHAASAADAADAPTASVIEPESKARP
ncbi:hypothetical protein ACFJGV_09055 [Cnuibacter sp. UC19_7]|uniref:hypothetical protein n=1 Tax=Cnuibacter sp. UC19_7 TaxID=3350166 RepID=UPI00366FDA68